MNLAAALAIAQGQIETASKDQTAKVKTKSGGEFTYKYSTLDDIWKVCRKPLSDNGLSVVQIPANDSDGFYLETILLHSSGEWMSGTLTLPIVADRMSQLQGIGSAITYARRYMLGAMVGVTTGDDDDGQSAGADKGNGNKSQSANSTGRMNLDSILALLKKVEVKGMDTFYDKPKDILACRAKGSPLPAADDTEGWRNLYADARDYAIDRINEAVMREDLAPDEPMPEAEAVQSAMDEIEADDTEEIPF
jgi:hypothetical protein